MKSGEKIVFVATGEVRKAKPGEFVLGEDGDGTPDGAVYLGRTHGGADRHILHRLSDAELARERECVEACKALEKAEYGFSLTRESRACAAAGRAIIDAEKPQPRYVADGGLVRDHSMQDMAGFIVVTDFYHTGPDAERHAREFADKLNAEASRG